MIVKGRIIRTWDGQLNADGQPDFVYAWTRNPAWVAADLLCNERYGIGAEVGEEGVDWPSFLEWARYCEEGVEDAFGELDVFGVDIEAYGVDGSTPIMTFYIGLTDDSGITQQLLPESWIKAAIEGGEYVYRAWVSVITAAGLNADWITVNDVEGGLNDASNRLGILSMDILDATSSGGVHGWYTYARVRARWNREDASGNLLPPDGYAISDEVYADDVGLTSLATISGVEQRAFCDIIFDEGKETAWQSVLQVFTAGRAMPIKAGKKIVAVIDRPRPTVASFTQANIVPGSLSITYTGAKQVVNSLEGDILDSQANYRKATILVDHPSIQDPAAFDSFRKERVDLRGITRRSHAIRECTYRLNTYHLRRRQVKFTVGPDAVHLLPGDRFRLSHDVPQYGFSGRLRADYGVTNAFPSGGSFYQSWNVQGGTVITSVFTLLFETTDTVPSAFSTSTVAPSQFISLPCQTLQGGLLSALPGTQGDGSEFDTLSEPTTYYGQVVAVANALYPPSPTTAPLDQIVGLSTYQAAFSVYVREE
ncbi:MAG: phage tail protein, partial [Alphaproteobacteria bacterium]